MTNPASHLFHTIVHFLMAARVILYVVERTMLLSSPNPSVVSHSPWGIVEIVSCVHHFLCGVSPPDPHTCLSSRLDQLTQSFPGTSIIPPLCDFVWAGIPAQRVLYHLDNFTCPLRHASTSYRILLFLLVYHSLFSRNM